MNALNRFTDPVFCITRLIVGLMFATHGGQLVFGMFGGKASDEMIMQVGGWIQLVGGLMLAFGLLTRFAAFICSGEMAVAYFKFHLLAGGFLAAKGGPINGELAVFYCWFFFFAIFYGSGRWSLDAMFFERSSAAAATT